MCPKDILSTPDAPSLCALHRCLEPAHHLHVETHFGCNTSTPRQIVQHRSCSRKCYTKT